MIYQKNDGRTQIILCADDYGQNEAISQAILQLIKANRLSAVSCLTNFPAWQQYAKQIKPCHKTISLGLHFNFTEGKPVHPNTPPLPTLKQLIWRCFTRRIQPTIIRQEFIAQLTAYRQAYGFDPDFIDGHQHIHHLPIIRDVILAQYPQQFIARRPAIRIASNPLSATLTRISGFPKTWLICLTGALRLKAMLQARNIPHNNHFEGIYSFPKAKHYRKFFLDFIKRAQDETLIMCHPGLAPSDSADSIGPARWQEFQYLISQQLLDDLTKYDFRAISGQSSADAVNSAQDK